MAPPAQFGLEQKADSQWISELLSRLPDLPLRQHQTGTLVSAPATYACFAGEPPSVESLCTATRETLRSTVVDCASSNDWMSMPTLESMPTLGELPSLDSPAVGQAKLPAPGRTTLMVRNIPPQYNQEQLAQEWAGARFDFLYLPRSGNGSTNVGYSFVNFVTEEDATNFVKRWHKAGLAHSTRRKILNISAAAIQGLAANVAEIAEKAASRGLSCEPLVLLQGRRVPLQRAHALLSAPAARVALP